MVHLSRRLSHIFSRNRALLSISLDWTRPKDPPMSLGQASLIAKLRHEKIPVIHRAWSVNDSQFNCDHVFDFVMSHAAEGVDLAMGAYVWHEPETQTLLDQLRKHNFPGRIILGGPQVSYTKRGLEDFYPQADVFIRGYGEEALARLWLSNQDKSAIAGVHYAGEPDLGLSANIDLENLPSPYLSGLIQPQPFIRWETQRGCPFRCAFCQHRESDSSMVRRQFNQTRIMQETEWILDHPIISDVAVLDPTFNSGPHYMAILERLIEGGYQGKLALQCRIEMVKPEFLDAIERLNQTAHVVLEFGLQTIHRDEEKFIQRPNNMRRVKRILQETRERRIATEVSLIFGLPGQTVQSFKDSIQFCKELGVPVIYAYPLMLLRGTPLYAAKDQLGLVESNELNLTNIDRVQVNIPHVVASPTFSYDDWCVMAEMAQALDQYNAGQLHTDKQPSGKMAATLNTSSLWQSRSANKQVHQPAVQAPVMGPS